VFRAYKLSWAVRKGFAFDGQLFLKYETYNLQEKNYILSGCREKIFQ